MSGSSKASLGARGRDLIRLVELSARLLAGRRFWLAPLLTLVWPAFQAFRLVIGWQQNSFEPVAAQTTLIGLPMILLAIGLGVRVIADEMDRRTLEIAYTVPGGSHRVWLGKLGAAVVLLLAAEALLAAATFIWFTSVEFSALYGSLQAALFYLVLAMGFAVLTRSEITGALATSVVFILNGFFTGFGGNQLTVSPTFNPLAIVGTNAQDVLARTVQNRVTLALAIAAVTALAFSRAERREKLLG